MDRTDSAQIGRSAQKRPLEKGQGVNRRHIAAVDLVHVVSVVRERRVSRLEIAGACYSDSAEYNGQRGPKVAQGVQ